VGFAAQLPQTGREMQGERQIGRDRWLLGKRHGFLALVQRLVGIAEPPQS
jgi:hypothetical protein